MATGDNTVTIEGFVTDAAFVDSSKTINGILIDASQKVGSLTPQALSYFTTPAAFQDHRTASTRSVLWPATTQPRLVIDSTVFETFVDTINALSNTAPVGFFKIIDKLLFDYNASNTHAAIEAALLADTDIAAIYVPGTFTLSSTIVSDSVYLTNSAEQTVLVPAYVNFQITLPTGSTTTTFSLQLYTSVDAWITGYNSSSIIAIIPPLPYNKLFDAPLTTSTDNIFATATTTATLAYVNSQTQIGHVSVSGIIEYIVALTDGTAGNTVPFNIMYKGRAPTTFEVRNAIKNALLTSGFGTPDGWKARIPGVFVSGRFYIVPFWDSTYSKPDQVLFPNISSYAGYATKTNKILSSLGYGDVSQEMDILSIYYNRMTASVIPDLSGTIAVADLISIVPDYQSVSPTDPQFQYMLYNSQSFSRDLNNVLAVEDGATTSQAYTQQSEGQLNFYTFTVENYEVCVITKLCYKTIIESTL